MSSTEVPEHATIQLDAQELDRIFFELYKRQGIDVEPQYHAEAYNSGFEDGTKAFHHEIIENADILIE